MNQDRFIKDLASLNVDIRPSEAIQFFIDCHNLNGKQINKMAVGQVKMYAPLMGLQRLNNCYQNNLQHIVEFSKLFDNKLIFVTGPDCCFIFGSSVEDDFVERFQKLKHLRSFI